MLGVQANGKEIITIEGLADGDELSPIQAAFQKTSRFAVWILHSWISDNLYSFLRDHPDPTEKDIESGDLR